MRNKITIKDKFDSNSSFTITLIIYALVNPVTNEIFYIGKTTRPLETRLDFHVVAARKEPGSIKKKNYILSLIKQNAYPIIKPIHRIKCKTFDEFLATSDAEKRWIKYFSTKTILVNSKNIK